MRIKVGDTVKFINKKAHEENPEWYPPKGTLGCVVDILKDSKYKRKVTYKIIWKRNSTSENDVWYAQRSWIRRA